MRILSRIGKVVSIGKAFNVLKTAGIIGLIGGMLYILYCAVRDPRTVHEMLGRGLMPRIVSWSCLIYGSYGLARGRISDIMALVFFLMAMFFAYVGPVVPFIRNYY